MANSDQGSEMGLREVRKVQHDIDTHIELEVACSRHTFSRIRRGKRRTMLWTVTPRKATSWMVEVQEARAAEECPPMELAVAGERSMRAHFRFG